MICQTLDSSLYLRCLPSINVCYIYNSTAWLWGKGKALILRHLFCCLCVSVLVNAFDLHNLSDVAQVRLAWWFSWTFGRCHLQVAHWLTTSPCWPSLFNRWRAQAWKHMSPWLKLVWDGQWRALTWDWLNKCKVGWSQKKCLQGRKFFKVSSPKDGLVIDSTALTFKLLNVCLGAQSHTQKCCLAQKTDWLWTQ